MNVITIIITRTIIIIVSIIFSLSYLFFNAFFTTLYIILSISLIVFLDNGLIFEVTGTWYGSEDEESWFNAYNWSCDIKEKPTDWNYTYLQFDSPYEFKKKYYSL